MSKKEINEILQRIQSLDERVLKLEEYIGSNPEKKITKKISIKEFYLSKNSNDDIQRTLLLAYYLEKYDGYPSINTKDIENACLEAKVNIPVDNIPYKLYKNVEKGYLMETKEKKDSQKAYILTNTGEKFVEGDFSKLN